tara:strand:+ start:84 stop:908 length:825 start_codon:yes stop_codon:yes gene_type:complete
MQLNEYPAQEPISEFARAYAEKVMQLGANMKGEDVQYGANPYQSLGIHKPLKGCGAVFMFIHGGGWTSGYKEWNNFMAPAFVNNDILFVTVGYRLAPMHLFPEGFNDCANAVAWVYNNATKYGANPNQIFLGGHSAGGHYASLLTVRDNWKKHKSLPDDVIKGCVPVSGVYRFGKNSGLNQRPRFLGSEGSGVAADASPILQINKVTADFYMAHGDDDFPHLIDQAIEMENVLKQAGTSIDRTLMVGCDHLGAHLATGDEKGGWFKGLLSFMGV